MCAKESVPRKKSRAEEKTIHAVTSRKQNWKRETTGIWASSARTEKSRKLRHILRNGSVYGNQRIRQKTYFWRRDVRFSLLPKRKSIPSVTRQNRYAFCAFLFLFNC